MDAKSASNSKQYFATLDSKELAAENMKKVSDYRDYLTRSGHFARMKKSYTYYYGFSDKGNFNSSYIGEGGEQGSLSMMRVNHFRNNIQHVLNMTTSQRPAMQCRASNTDVESDAQVILGDGLLDFYMREKRLEKNLKAACETCLVFSEGFLEVDWDTEAGEEYGVEMVVDAEGNPVIDQETGEQKKKIMREGDLKYRVHMPIMVTRDYLKADEDHDWVIIETQENKYNLAAQYPEFAEKILDTSMDTESFRFKLNNPKSNSQGDQICVFKFMHRPTTALPKGRLQIYINSEIVLFDDAFPFENMPGGLPVYKINPGEFMGTTFGYTPAFDALSIQEAVDALYSVVVTNQTNFGVQNITAPKGSAVIHTAIAAGLNLIEYDKLGGPPQALELCKTPAEIFEFIPALESLMRIIFGLNDVVIGDPQASLKSGSALALVASQAIQFNSGLQQSWAELLENVGLCTLKMLQQFANTRRVAAIVGKHNRSYLRYFKGTDLARINRVVVDISNPLSRTSAGRLEQANALLNAQAVDKNEYLMVVQTGKIEPMLEGPTSQLMLIRAENEKLRNGQGSPTLVTDKHSLHIQEHFVVLNSPEARANPALAQAALIHILEHLNHLRTADPALLAMLGEQSLAQFPPGAFPMPGQPAGSPPQMPQGPNPAQVPEPVSNQAMPSQPSMPTNPLSGQQYNPQSGGL